MVGRSGAGYIGKGFVAFHREVARRCNCHGGELPLEAVPLLCGLFEVTLVDDILCRGWVGYLYTKNIINEPFVEDDVMRPKGKESVFR